MFDNITYSLAFLFHIMTSINQAIQCNKMTIKFKKLYKKSIKHWRVIKHKFIVYAIVLGVPLLIWLAPRFEIVPLVYKTA